jgi:MFS family permease
MWARLGSAFMVSWMGLLAIGSFLAGIIVFFVAPDKATLPMNWALLIMFLLLSIACVALLALKEALRTARMVAPKVTRIVDATPDYPGAAANILVEPGPFFAANGIVSVYYNDAGYERLVTVGIVTNIQSDGMVQVALVKSPELDESLQRIKSHHVGELAKLIVKPTVPRKYLRE